VLTCRGGYLKMKKTVAIAHDDGRVELIDADTLTLARALETLAKDPKHAAEIKAMATFICFAAAAQKLCPTPHPL